MSIPKRSNRVRISVSTLAFLMAAAFLIAAPGDENWDSQFDAQGLDGEVNAIAVGGNGDVYVGGSFTHAGSLAVDYIAKWDGTGWSALGSGLDFDVFGIAVSGSDVYAVGIFGLAKWDGVSWTSIGKASFGSGQQILYAVAVIGSDVYVGGTFTTIGGVSANHVAKWNGSSWSALGTGIGASYYPKVRAIAVVGGYVYVGGDFLYAGGNNISYLAKWDGSNWSNVGGGVAGQVKAIAVAGSDIYVGGYLISGTWVNGIARWNGSSWSALGSDGGLGGEVDAIAVSGGNIYVTGTFYDIGGSGNVADGTAKWDGSSWSALGSGLGPQPSASGFAIGASGNDVYVGGYFTTAGGKASKYFGHYVDSGGGPDIALTGGVGYDDSLASGTQQAGWKYYYIDVPSGAASLVVDLYNLTDDVDLYVRYNAKPDLAGHDCTSQYGGTSSEKCTFNAPSAGRWWIGVNNYVAGTISYTVKATVTGSVAPTVATGSPLPSGTVGSAYSKTLAATGGTTPYSWSVVSGSLPSGLSLSASGVISGTPSAATTASFTVRVTGANNLYSDKDFNLTVAANPTAPIVTTSSPLATGTVNVAYSQTLAATGGTTPYTWSIASGSLPSGLTLSAGGVISGTPSTAMTASFTVRVTGANNLHSEKNLSLTINTAPPPTITTSSSLPSGAEGVQYFLGLMARGGTAPYTWSIVSGSLPAGLGLISDGSIYGYPSEATTNTFRLRVIDVNGLYSQKDFTLVIVSPGGCSYSISPATNIVTYADTNGWCFSFSPLNGCFPSPDDFHGESLWIHSEFQEVERRVCYYVDVNYSENPRTDYIFLGNSVHVVIQDGWQAPSSTNQLGITKLQVKLNLARTNADSCSLTATLDPGVGFNPAGKTFMLDIGGVRTPFALDGKGRGVGAYGNCRLSYSKSKGVWTFTAKLRSGSWQDQWAILGLMDDTVPKPGTAVTMPVNLLLGAESFAGDRQLVYTAKAGKSGTAK